MTATAPIPVLSPVTPASRMSSGIVLAVASALAFSSSGPLVKPLLEAGWSIGAALLVRMGVSGLILVPALLLAIRRQRRFVRRHSVLIVGFGLTAVAGCQIFFFSAMQRMPVAVALLIQYLAPVLLVLFAWARTRTAPSRLVIAGSLVAIVGLVLVVDISGAQFDLLGTLFALAAAICVGAYFLISERAGDDLPPVALASGGLLVGTALMVILAAIGVFPLVAPMVDVTFAGVTVPWWMPLLWVAGVATTIGYAFGVMAVPRVGSRIASFVGLSEVLFALGFAWLLLGETPAPIQFVGGALILVGVVLVRMDASSAGEPRGAAATIPVVPAP
ncbi:EamA family transporter [Microbacterium sp.]|uniref:EamA family transporter n=1 Tax=Microbacterium sp. TaxID=51671 RepID=UPI003F71EC45